MKFLIIGSALLLLVSVILCTKWTRDKHNKHKTSESTRDKQNKQNKTTQNTSDPHKYDKYHKYVSILTPLESLQVIKSNQTFWEDLDHEEWRKRNVNTFQEYIQSVHHDFVEPTPDEYQMLYSACQQADQLFANHTIPNFAGEMAVKIPWKIGVFQGTRYEFGWPHTMSDVIFIPKHSFEDQDDKLVKLLVHEKVHLYQRLFCDLTQQYLRQFGFVKWRRRTQDDKHIRPNPDLDGWIYKQFDHPYGMELMHQVPTPDTNPQFYEHPYERMAIEISRVLCST